MEEVKNIILTFKRWLTSVWKKVGGSRQDSTSVYSETPGVLDDGTASRIYDNEQHERAMKKDIDKDDLQQRIRKAGY